MSPRTNGTAESPAVTPRRSPREAGSGPGVRRTFAALRHPNYRLWFAGQTVSLFGTWMQSTAQGFLVFDLTRSPAYLGYVGFANGLPVWLFMLYGGVMSDRVSRQSVLVVTQSCMMVLAFVLAALTFAGAVRPWHIVLLASGLGLANAFDAPARQAFVSELVGREDLTNAIALNSAMFNMATAVGPAVAGITYHLFGPGWCFTINGLSFIAVILCLRAMTIAARPATARTTSARAELKEALAYVATHPVIRALVLLVGLVGWFGISFLTLIPAWAVTILNGDETTNGWLLSARGVGALVAALLIASLGRFQFKGRLLTFGTFALPACLAAFAFTRVLPLSLACLAAVGFSVILVNNLANALVQTLVPDAMRGRVMGVYTLTFFGFMPIGALWVGAIAEQVGAPAAVLVNAVVWFGVAGLAWLVVPRLRALE
jgi:MFS family permease